MKEITISILEELFQDIKITFQKMWTKPDKFEEEIFYQFVFLTILQADYERFSKIVPIGSKFIVDKETVDKFWLHKNSQIKTFLNLEGYNILMNLRDERLHFYLEGYSRVLQLEFLYNGEKPSETEITSLIAFTRHILMNVDQLNIMEAYDIVKGFEIIKLISNSYILYLNLKNKHKIIP